MQSKYLSKVQWSLLSFLCFLCFRPSDQSGSPSNNHLATLLFYPFVFNTNQSKMKCNILNNFQCWGWFVFCWGFFSFLNLKTYQNVNNIFSSLQKYFAITQIVEFSTRNNCLQVSTFVCIYIKLHIYLYSSFLGLLAFSKEKLYRKQTEKSSK